MEFKFLLGKLLTFILLQTYKFTCIFNYKILDLFNQNTARAFSILENHG